MAYGTDWMGTAAGWLKSNPEIAAALIGVGGGLLGQATAKKGDIKFKQPPETPEQLALRMYAQKLAGVPSTPGGPSPAGSMPTFNYLFPQIDTMLKNYGSQSAAYRPLPMLDPVTNKVVERPQTAVRSVADFNELSRGLWPGSAPARPPGASVPGGLAAGPGGGGKFRQEVPMDYAPTGDNVNLLAGGPRMPETRGGEYNVGNPTQTAYQPGSSYTQNGGEGTLTVGGTSGNAMAGVVAQVGSYLQKAGAVATVQGISSALGLPTALVALALRVITGGGSPGAVGGKP